MAQPDPAQRARQFWTPEVIRALVLLLDRCEPHGNIKPCVHCTYTARVRP